MGLTQYEEKYPLTSLTTLTNAQGTTATLLLTSGIGGMFRLDTISLTTDSAVDLTVEVGAAWDSDIPSTFVKMGTVVVTAVAGDGTVAPVDGLSGLPTPLQAGFPLGIGAVVALRMVTAIAAGKKLWVTAFGGEL